jgi:hypothetical protein
MIAETWTGFFTIACIALSFFFAGILWEHESAAKREEQRAARRRAHRINTKQKEGN